METKLLGYKQRKAPSRGSKVNGVQSLARWANKPNAKRILFLLDNPSTPRDVEKALSIGKIKMKPYLDKGLIFPLNSNGRKGRLYTLTPKARKI